MGHWRFFLKLFVLFFIGSIFGCIVETIYAFIKTGGYQIRQGLVYGPFIPVYGLGTLLFYFILLITKKPLNVFVTSVFILVDVVISCLASDRQQERKNNIEPQNSIDVFLDKHYPDEFLDKIYNNKIWVNPD